MPSLQPSPGCVGAVPSRLVSSDLLDPRPPEDAQAHPIPGAVNIPFAGLRLRVHELPPKGELLRIAGPPELAAEVVAWLERSGRRAVPAGALDGQAEPAPAAAHRLWRPNAFLAAVLPRLPLGRALDLGCGSGRDAVYLASCGWTVTAIDVLPDALARAADLERRYLGPLQRGAEAAYPPVRGVVHDLVRTPAVDLGTFTLVTMFWFLRRVLLSRLDDWLRPGGSFLCEVYTELHRQRHGKPARAGHVVVAGELPALLGDRFEIRYSSEAWLEDAHTARVWAVRKG